MALCACVGFAAPDGVVAGAPAVPAGAQELRTDVCVVGAGSAGMSAAIGTSRAGVGVILVERQDRLGGTSTNGYVCNWEPGVGNPLAHEIYDRLRKLPNAVGITKDHNPDRKLGPFGLWLITPGLTYEQTLHRAGVHPSKWRAMVYDPDALNRVAGEIIDETGRCRVLLNTTFTAAKTRGRRVESIQAVAEGGQTYCIRAKVFVDSTGDGYLCRLAGCETMLGPESKARFGEPDAPDDPGKTLNAISLCYRIHKPRDRAPVRQAPPEPAVRHWPKSAHVSALPNGDRLVNPLAMLPGRALIDLGYEQCYRQATRIAHAHWRWLQGYPTFAGYELHSLAPMLGIRESRRVVGEYVLTQHDLEATLKKQTHADIIALADHAMDTHGKEGRCTELKGPYGIPYRCLIPKGWTNLLIACRGASFSHIAASSCRLNRTMIAIGNAAGVAAAMASRADVPVGKIDVTALQKMLGIQLP